MFLKKGQIALSFVLLVSGVIVEIVIAGSFVTYFLSNSGLGERLESRAVTAAYSGLWDALARISKNRDFLPSSNPYGLTINNDSATIDVSRVLDSGAGVYVYSITSLGTAGTRERSIFGKAIVDRNTGQIQLQSVTDQALQ